MDSAHTTILKVRGYHTDMFGHVNNARYLEFLEEARWNWLDEITSFDYFVGRGLSFVVVSISINYRWPAVLGDELHINVIPDTMGNRSATVKQEIFRAHDRKAIADASVTFALIDTTTGKSAELDEELKAILGK